MLSLLLAAHVFWTFESGVIDVLETSTDGQTWTAIPGPYALTEDRREYKVPVAGGEPMKFFRVNRWWGEPWILP